MSRFAPQFAQRQNGVPSREWTEQEMIDQNITGPAWDHFRVLGVSLPLTAEDAYVNYIDRGHGCYMQWDRVIKKFVIQHDLLILVKESEHLIEHEALAPGVSKLRLSGVFY